MTQHRTHDFAAPRTTDLLNTKWERLIPACATKDISVQKGTGDYDLTINIGSWLCDGVCIHESSALTDELTLDDPSGLDRIDVIYGTFTYEADTEPTPASYSIKKGTPSATPAEPAVGTNEVKLASIYVPTTAVNLDDCYVYNVRTLQGILSSLLGIQIEGSLWIQEAGDPFLTSGNPTVSMVYEYGIKDADLWVNTTGLDLYLYDADLNQWVSSDVTAHATTHSSAGSDEVDLKNLADSLNYRHFGTASVHNAMALNHANLSNVTVNQHHTQDHKTRHHLGGADVVDVKDLADTTPYLHLHATALSQNPHGSDDHSVSYAPNPHDHDSHSGAISRGQYALVESLAADASPVGAAVLTRRLPRIEVAKTNLLATELWAYASTGPSENITYTVHQNAVPIGSVTILSGQLSGTTDIANVTLADGDALTLDAPADAKGALGVCIYLTLERVAV